MYTTAGRTTPSPYLVIGEADIVGNSFHVVQTVQDSYLSSIYTRPLGGGVR